jgi:hypothetical protein
MRKIHIITLILLTIAGFVHADPAQPKVADVSSSEVANAKPSMLDRVTGLVDDARVKVDASRGTGSASWGLAKVFKRRNSSGAEVGDRNGLGAVSVRNSRGDTSIEVANKLFKIRF